MIKTVFTFYSCAIWCLHKGFRLINRFFLLSSRFTVVQNRCALCNPPYKGGALHNGIRFGKRGGL